MVWRLFATKLESAETMEGVALNMRAPYFYPTSTQIKYLRQQTGHVSFEDVCSGMGFQNLCRFLKETGQSEVPSWFEEQLDNCLDPTILIIEAAVNADRSWLRFPWHP